MPIQNKLYFTAFKMRINLYNTLRIESLLNLSNLLFMMTAKLFFDIVFDCNKIPTNNCWSFPTLLKKNKI